MNVVLLEQIASILLQAVEAGIKYGPEIIADLKLVYNLATSGTTITPDQQVQADTAIANAHQALQAQISLDAQQDAGDLSA